MSKKKSTAAVKPVPTGKIYDFCGKKKMIFAIAIVVILAFIVGIAVRGVDLAIEFKGGTMLNYSYTGDLDINAAANKAQEIVGVNVTARQGEDLESDGYQLTLSFSSEEGLNADRQFELTNALMELFPDNDLVLYDSNDVSPSSGREFLLKCFLAMVVAAVLIIIYIAIRFSKIGGWSAGICSIFALCHDLVAALAASIIFGFEFNANIVAVILTILGYSINNTIVIYDRIRENRQLYPKADLNELINMGCSQSLRRSIRTSITTIGTMVVVAIVVFVSGYNSLLSFAVPLIFGLISGTYSSIFVAPVTWSWWKNRAEKKKGKE